MYRHTWVEILSPLLNDVPAPSTVEHELVMTDDDVMEWIERANELAEQLELWKENGGA